ncbi:hypothetical protein BDY21DRAFT_259245, partial [Lineolata rhizophorae]
VERLAAAVKVPTESYDDSGLVGEDSRWDVFAELHRVLKEQFPLVHEHLKVDKPNTYGLLYTFEGSDPSLKPLLFMAHQDVVPAGPASKWTYPPYDAHFDGTHLWGRGASDCKNNLIGLLSVFEALLAQRFRPRRTLLLASGFDEEIGGARGAAHLAAEVERRHGRHGVRLVLDEGGMEVQTRRGAAAGLAYAVPAIAEKGYLDVNATVVVPGGHSSRPPPHTGIGAAAALVAALEAKPFKPRLGPDHPLRNVLECEVAHDPEAVEKWLRRDLTSADADPDVLGLRVAENMPETRWLVQTSQAVDVIRGGSKTNQLPETVEFWVNYRVAPHQTLRDVKAHIRRVLEPVAEEYGLEVRGLEDEGGDNGVQEDGPHAKRRLPKHPAKQGTLYLTSKDDLSPSPVSSTGADSPTWSRFAGVLRAIFEDSRAPEMKGRTVVPAGGIMTGNTDTLHYWNVSRNIYRFSPAREGSRIGVHTVDERIEMRAHIEGMRVYYGLAREFD